ncbi:SanA protein [Vibrio astriarenae]|uniref:SanA protein n=1 Tax=Vibrio astriarenae TaxID=1481923 RepID=A0A7Z2YDQ2_9VIBR|nr:ElyC/SanA/YdcF family protein [Vibrio astriarenae]QIA63603.1 SanA protein [Vibrio astriarenae]
MLQYLILTLKGLFLIVLLAFVSVIAIDTWITKQNQDVIYTDLSQVPDYDVGLVLGTSKYLGRTLNLFYQYRIDATQALFEQGKIKHVLLSGDNAHRSYNEPWTMKRDFLKLGLTEEQIHLDYAGFRTLDSVVRAKEIFDTNRFIVITQRFHCERAMFIARNIDIDAACFAAQTPGETLSVKLRVRELLARVKAVLDLFIFNTQPKFLGPKEPITSDVIFERLLPSSSAAPIPQTIEVNE